ncbi:unnamed protein product, partial [Phaeothamnion confervicola]
RRGAFFPTNGIAAAAAAVVRRTNAGAGNVGSDGRSRQRPLRRLVRRWVASISILPLLEGAGDAPEDECGGGWQFGRLFCLFCGVSAVQESIMSNNVMAKSATTMRTSTSTAAVALPAHEPAVQRRCGAGTSRQQAGPSPTGVADVWLPSACGRSGGRRPPKRPCRTGGDAMFVCCGEWADCVLGSSGERHRCRPL